MKLAYKLFKRRDGKLWSYNVGEVVDQFALCYAPNVLMVPKIKGSKLFILSPDVDIQHIVQRFGVASDLEAWVVSVDTIIKSKNIVATTTRWLTAEHRSKSYWANSFPYAQDTRFCNTVTPICRVNPIEL